MKINSKLSEVWDQIARDLSTDRAGVLVRAITMMELAEEKRRQGYKLVFEKDGSKQEILFSDQA